METEKIKEIKYLLIFGIIGWFTSNSLSFITKEIVAFILITMKVHSDIIFYLSQISVLVTFFFFSKFYIAFILRNTKRFRFYEFFKIFIFVTILVEILFYVSTSIFSSVLAKYYTNNMLNFIEQSANGSNFKIQENVIQYLKYILFCFSIFYYKSSKSTNIK